MSFGTVLSSCAKTLCFAVSTAVRKGPRSCVARLNNCVTPSQYIRWGRVLRRLQGPMLSAAILATQASTTNGKSETPQPLSSTDVANILKKVDELINNNQFEELCKFLRPYKDSGCVDLVWRLSYAAYTWRKTATNLSKEEFAALTNETYEMAKLALELDDKSAPAHKWFAIALDAKSELGGFRSRLNCINTVKDHMLISHRLDPSDATITYMLGVWYYEIANLAWYQRKVLQAVAGKPDPATFEDALTYFKEAEEISPNFYSLNLLMLGKCHLKLGDEETAAMYLQRTISYPKRTYDDHKAHEEATQLLKQIKVPIGKIQ